MSHIACESAKLLQIMPAKFNVLFQGIFYTIAVTFTYNNNVIGQITELRGMSPAGQMRLTDAGGRDSLSRHLTVHNFTNR